MNDRFISDKFIYILLFVYTFLFTYFFLGSSPLFHYYSDLDPNIYFNIGKGWFNGYLPYRDVFEQKGPVLYLIYGLGYFLSNTDFTGVFFIQTLFFFLNVLFGYKLAELFLSRQYSYIIAILYPVALSVCALGGGSAEEFISTFQTIGLYLFFRAFKEDRGLEHMLFYNGILIGLTFLIKFNLILFWFPFIVVSFLILFQFYGLKKLFNGLLVFVLGIFIVFIPFLIYFILTGTFSDFFSTYIVFNYKYSKSNVVPISYIGIHFINYIKYHWLLLSLVVIGILYFTFSKQIFSRRIYGLGVLFSFLLTYAMVLPSVHPYYYISMNVYSILGLITLFILLNKILIFKFSYLIIFLTSILGLVLGFNVKRSMLAKDRDAQKEIFSSLVDIIKEEENPTIIYLGLATMPSVYADINSTFKYFFYPNVPYDITPQIRDYQDSYIINKEPLFILSYSDSYYYRSYYTSFKPLHDNYLLVKEIYDSSQDRFYFLYKRRN